MSEPFHGHDDCQFQRGHNGHVAVVIHQGDMAFSFTPDEWVSIIANVSTRGDTPEALAQARELHEAK